MKRNRRFFKKSEKVVIFLFSVVAVLLFVQAASLYSDKQAEVRATTKHKLKSEQPVELETKETPKEIEKTPETAWMQNTQQDSETPSVDEQENVEEVDKPKQASEKESEKPTADESKAENKKVAYITIDDGPSNVEHELLDLLDAYQAKATFFMLEPNMRKYPDAVKRIVNDGHVAALHGVTHNAKKFYRSTNSVLHEMNTAQKTLEELTSFQATLIRTPYGSSPQMTPAYKQAVTQQGYQLWDWNVDSQDWKYTNGSFVQHTIGQIENLASKGEAPIILIHSKPTTLTHLPKLLDYLVKQGYSLEPLDETMEPFQLK